MWSTSDERLLVGYDDSTLQIWNPLTSAELQSIQEAPAPLVISWLDTSRIMVSDAETSPSSNQKKDTSIRVWDAVTGHKLVTYTAHTAIPDTFDTSPDGRRVLSTSNRESLLWDSTTGKTILHIPTGESLRRPSFSPNGEFVEDASGTNAIRIWDATTGKTVANYHVSSNLAPIYNVDSIYWLNENSLVVVRGGKIWILAPMTGQVRYSFDLHTPTAPYLQWSTDYKKIAATLDNGTVEIVQGID
jgi:WD40 repeat protein